MWLDLVFGQFVHRSSCIRAQVSVLVGLGVGAVVSVSLSNETACWLSAHWRELADWLPEPGETWYYRDIRAESPFTSATLLVSKGVVEKVERDADRVWSYRTRENAYARVMDYVAKAEE